MPFLEKSAWIFSLTAVIGFLAYAIVIFGRARGVPIAEVAYVGPMLCSIGGTVAATVVVTIAIAIRAPREVEVKDERDALISRHGDAVGLWVLSLGVLIPLAMTMAEFAHFWIANAIYLASIVSAVSSTAAKLVAYRRGFQPW